MGRIVILPDTLCNQIAAGEVVERPAAVVKELLENSIDAGSRKISVALLDGGRKEIRVVDNGTGMSRDDALLAVERHATSKIRTLDDLQSIQSLGFRGEALPSIAAVSRFELVARESQAPSGVSVRMEGGILKDVRETGCPPGTMITVRDLFHNMPARRKFLRSIDTEMAHISEQFLRCAMAHPAIHFQLNHQGRPMYDFPRAASPRERAGQILGIDLTPRLHPFSLRTPSLHIHGLASPPDLQRASGNALFVYVNGRPVWDRPLNRAILDAYDTLLPKGRYPVLVLFVEMPPDAVDVNVHPTKREVRFRSPGEVLDAVRTVVRQAAEEAQSRGRAGGEQRALPAGPSQRAGAPGPFTRERQAPIMAAPAEVVEQGGQAHASTPGPAPGVLPMPVSVFTPPFQMSAFPAGDLESFTAAGVTTDGEPLFAHLPVIGQLASTYILLESPEGLIIIDQHAAHERIIYNALVSAPTRPPAQRLIRSVVLDLLPREAATLRRWISGLGEAGFEIEPFGGDSFLVQTVPAILGDQPPDLLIRDLLASAHEEESSPRRDLVAHIARTAACHRAIRAGQRLRKEEIRALLEELDRARVSATCPHGRPVWVKISNVEVARLFLRT